MNSPIYPQFVSIFIFFLKYLTEIISFHVYVYFVCIGNVKQRHRGSVLGFFMNQFLLSRYSIISFSSIQFSVNILLYIHIVNILLYWCQPHSRRCCFNTSVTESDSLNPFSDPNPGILLNSNLYPGFSKYGTGLRHFAESGCGSLDLDPDFPEYGSRQKFTVEKILLKTL